MESIYNKLERARKPRVHIKYELEMGSGKVTKEIPFVVGVLGDFSGDSANDLRPLRERKFVQIDRDNFDEVMKKIAPAVNLQVKNTIQNDGTEMRVNLKFESIEDFEPARVAAQVPALNHLLNTRNKLRDLLTKIDRSDELEELLEQILQDNAALQKFAEDLKNKETV
ncbi:MAG: type VI secretion system contractile sheath small subunit [Proteobacteria bacterium]|nr:type VI secretion system contractile sheath small subunit [Pseudomonadota bacterium]